MASRSLVVNFVGDTKALEASVKRTNAQLGTLKKTGDQASFSISRIGSGAGPGIAGVSGKTAALAGGVASLSAAMPGLVGGFAALAGTGIGIGAVAGGVAVLSSSFQELAQTNKSFAASLVPVKNELQSAFNNAARPLITQLQPILKALPATIHELAPAFGQVFGAAAGMIAPLAAGLTNLAKTALPAVSGILKAATTLVKPLLTGLGQFIKILGPGITQAVKTVQPLLAPFLKGFGTALQGIMTGLNVMLKALGPVIGQLGGVFGTIGKDLGGLFATLAPAIKAGTQVFGVLIDVIAGILPVFGKIAAALANALAPAFTALAGIVKKLLPDLTPLINIFAQFAGAVLTDLAGVLGAVAKLFQGLAPTFKTLAGVAGQVFRVLENSNVFAVLADALERLAPMLAQLVNHFVTGLAPILPVIVAALGQLVNTGINTLVQSFQILVPIALNLLNQFLTPLLPLIKSLAPVVNVLAQAFGAGLVAEVQILAPILAQLAPEILAVWSAVKLWTIAQGLLDIAMDANPIVALGVAIAAIAGGVIYLATKTHVLQDAWSAIKGALNVVIGAITSGWNSVKKVTESVFNAVLGFVKSYWPELIGVFTFGLGTVIGLVIQNWGTVKKVTMDVFNAILGFVKQYWPFLIGVFTGGVGTIVGLVIQHWGAIKSGTVSVFNSIKGFVSGVWQAISGAISGAIGGAVDKVKTAIGGLTTWLSTAWGNIKSGVSSFASSIKTGVLTAIQGAINLVIGFLNDIIGVLDKLPFVNIKKIAPLSLTNGSGNQGPTSTTSNASAGGFNNFTGGVVQRPTYMVGEEAPKHPEYVLATNPAYRQRNVGLWQQAGSALGVPGFAQGGIPGYAEGGEVAKEVGDYFMSKGAARVAAAAVMGNSFQESGWNTESQDGPGNFPGDPGGAGLAGWTPGTKIPGYAGYPMAPGTWSQPSTQAQLYWYGDSASPGIASLMPAMGKMSLDEATSYFFDNWEHGSPTYENLPNREHGAQMAFNILGGKGIGPIFATGGASPLGSAIGGAVSGLLKDGAKALIGELPSLSKLPSWLKGLGGSLIGDATGYLKSKASSLLSDIGIGGGGGSNSGVSGQGLPQGVSVPNAGYDPLGKPIDNWIQPILAWAWAHGAHDWSVTSGYRTPAQQIAAGDAYGTSHYAGGNVLGSNHVKPNYPGGAVDINNAPALNAILQGYPNKPTLVWGGPVIGDEVHFSATGHAKGGVMGGTMDAFAQGGVPGHLGTNTGHLGAAFGWSPPKAGKKKPKKTQRPQPKRGNAKGPWETVSPSTSNGPLQFSSSDLTGLNSKLGAIFALDGGNAGLGIGADGDTTKLSALISTNTGNWSDDTLFPPPNFGSIGDPTQFVVIPDALADGTQPPAYLSPNLTGVSSKLTDVVGWEQDWVGDLQQTVTLSKAMAKPIEDAIKRRVAQITKIKARVEANLKKIKGFNDQIGNNQTALADISKTALPYPNPKNDKQRKQNKEFLGQQASIRSQIASRITGLQKKIAPLEAENMTLTGSKTAGGTKGELNTIQTQLGVPGASASSLAAAEGGGGTSATGLYGLQGTVAGWPGMINSTGGDLDVQQQALAVYKKQLSNLGTGAQAALVAANSSATSLTGTGGATDTTGGATSTTGGETLQDQVKDQMIEALGLRARSAEALLKAEVPIQGFAQGGVPFGGWFGTGGDITASQPTLIGIGDGPGTETATIRRQGQGMDDGIHVHNHFAPGMEIFADLITTTVERREQGQVRNANRQLPGAGGGFTRFRR